MKFLASLRGVVWCAWLGAVSLAAQEVALTPDVLQGLLARFPAADTNRDGVLSEAEARAYYAQMRAAKASAPKAAAASAAPAPTMSDVAYGPATRNVLDFWRAPAERPTPVVIFIHGGGFVSGDKSVVRRDTIVQECLAAGVSFAAINYRYLAPGVPIQDVLRDCARAVQFIRAQAAEWNVDKTRVASYGSSAGAGASLWLAFHDEMADPQSADPVLRESTRLVCAGSIAGQFSYDFARWTEVFGEEAVQRFGGIYRAPTLYGFATAAEFNSPAGKKIRADCDMLGLITKDDAPVFVSASLPGVEMETTNQFLHHPKHSQLLYERCRELGVPVVASIPALGIKPAAGGPGNWREFVFERLGVKRAVRAP